MGKFSDAFVSDDFQFLSYIIEQIGVDSMTKIGERITVMGWGKSTDLAITFYIERLAIELAKYVPVQLVDIDDKASLTNALAAAEQGRVEHWISVAHAGSFEKTFFPIMGVSQAQAFAEKSKIRNVHISYDWDYSTIIDFPLGTLYTSFTESMLAGAQTFFQRPAALGLLAHAAVPDVSLDWRDRDIDIIFPGHLRFDPAELRQNWRSLPGLGPKIMEDILDAWNGEPNKTEVIPLPHVYAAAHQAHGGDFPLMYLFEYLDHFDNYLRCQARFDLVSRVTHAPITFVGSGWDRYAASHHRILPPMSQEKVMTLVRRSKILLNMSAPYFKSHERIFYGMAAGVPVGTYGKGFLANAEDPAPDEPIIYLEPESIDHTLCQALRNSDQLQHLAMRANERFLTHHTWKHRAFKLLSLMQEAAEKIPL